MKVECPKCGTEFESESRKFCSAKCSNSRGPRSIETKQKLSAALAGRRVGGAVRKADPNKKEKRKCLTCDETFVVYKTSNVRHCSLKCGTKKCGGYREGSGWGKSGWYRGIYCASTYELAWVIYRLDHQLPVHRFDGYLQDGTKKYYPDFLIGERHIIEIKGYHQPDVDWKTALAERDGYTIEVLYKQDLRPCFEWVQEKYGMTISRLKELYEDFRPQYRYTCAFCTKEFETTEKRDTAKIFCSRSCSGKSTQKQIRGKHRV